MQPTTDRTLGGGIADPVPADASVGVAVITFNPPMARFHAVLRAASREARHVLVVDNHSADQATVVRAAESTDSAASPIHVTTWDRNRGLGAAYNHALEWAAELGLDKLVLLDQDSILVHGAVRSMLERKMRAQQSSAVVAVAAVPLDARRRTAVSTAAKKVIQTSGCMLDVERAKIVGRFDDELFIHHVDQEWFLRAQALGFTAIVDRNATMDHLSGDDVTVIGPWSVPRYSPTRMFYVVRNTLWMLRRRAVPFRWKVRYGAELLVQTSLHLGRSGPRRAHLDAVRAGAIAGLRRDDS